MIAPRYQVVDHRPTATGMEWDFYILDAVANRYIATFLDEELADQYAALMNQGSATE